MELQAQIITKDGEREFVVLPYNEFLKIQQTLEDYEDLRALRKAKAATISEPSIPFYEIEKKIRKSKLKSS